MLAVLPPPLSLFLRFPLPASGDQVNLWNLWSLSTRPSGQNHCPGRSGKKLGSHSAPSLKMRCVLCILFVFPLANVSACFSFISQQGNFNSSVGPDGYMLSALTCGMSPVTSITEGLQQVHDRKLQEIAPQQICKFKPNLLFWNSRTDRHHGIVSDHRTFLPGELWQHRAPLHDSKGAVKSGQ